MNDRRENDLIFKALLNEVSHNPEDMSQAEWNSRQEHGDPMAAPFYDEEASEGEDHPQIGANNEDELVAKANKARSQIREIVAVLPLDQQASVWQAILEDTNLAGRVIERWDHARRDILLQSLKDHGEDDWLRNIIPARKPAPTVEIAPDVDDPHSGIGDSSDPEGTIRP